MEGYNMPYVLGFFVLYTVFTVIGATPLFSAFAAVEEYSPVPSKNHPIKSVVLVVGTALLMGWFFGFSRLSGFSRLREGFIAGFMAVSVRDGRVTREAALEFVRKHDVSAEELDRYL